MVKFWKVLEGHVLSFVCWHSGHFSDGTFCCGMCSMLQVEPLVLELLGLFQLVVGIKMEPQMYLRKTKSQKMLLSKE